MTPFRYVLISLVVLFISYLAVSTGNENNDVVQRFPHLSFIENEGQWPHAYAFEASIGHSKVFLEPGTILYSLIDPDDIPHHGHPGEHHVDHSDNVVKGHAFRVNFNGANRDAVIKGKEKQSVYHNYFIGNDSTRWRSGVGLYSRVMYDDLYDGIDLEYYQSEGLLKYDFIISPGANPQAIKMSYEGLDRLQLKKGKLHLETSIEEIVEQKPYAYQVSNGIEHPVDCRFKLEGNEVTFELPNGYDRDLPLIIDPILIFSTFSGSTGDNFGVTAAFDSQGNGYSAGMQFNFGYPTTIGAFETAFSGGDTDLSISKFNSTGTNHIYSTYLGGSATDIPHSLIVNSRDELIVFGTTSSLNLPVTPNAYDRTFNGGPFEIGLFGSVQYLNGSDIFITKFNFDGSDLLGSTYLGGDGSDGVNNAFELVGNYADEFRGEVNIDDADDIFIASTTTSRDFPVSADAFSASHNGGNYDAVVVKFDPDLTNLIWASYFGGDEDDVAYSMKLDDQSNVYFTGGTVSDDLPTQSNAVQTNFQGGVTDGYLGQFSADGRSLLACTYLGTPDRDQSYFIEIDPMGQVFSLGTSRGGNYPVTGGVYSNPNSAQYLHKMSPDLSTTEFSTVLGNGTINGRLALNAFMIDDCHRIYISAWGGNTNDQATNVFNMPITADAFQSTTDGSDFYFLVLEPDARDIEYGTFFGGSSLVGEHVDGGTSRFDRRGVIYQAVCAGCGGTDDFPTSVGAYSTLNGSPNCNLALIKFDFQLDEILVDANVLPTLTGCAPFQVTFLNQSIGPIDIFEWDFGDGSTSEEVAPVHTYEAGSFRVRLIGSSDFACVAPDTVYLDVEVFDPLESNESTVTKCTEDPITLSSSYTGNQFTYLWRDGSTTPEITVSEPGLYWVHSFSIDGCFIDSIFVENLPVPSALNNVGGCEPEDYILEPLNIDPDLSYRWQDGSTGQTFEVTDAGVYWVQTLDPNECDRIDSFIVEEYPIKAPVVREFELCPGKSTRLTPTNRGSELSYEWHDGSTNEDFSIDGPGVYWVVTSFPDECPLTDSFIVVPDEFNPPTLDSIRICEESLIEIGSNQNRLGALFNWSTSDTTPTIEVGQTGVYEVITDFNRICPFTDRFAVNAFPVIDENDIYFPNAFSPNDDGINEIFRPYFSRLVTVLDYELHVYNRWGQKVFESRSPEIGWDGHEFRQSEAVAVYVWHSRVNLISCTGEPLDVNMKGDVTIMK